MVLRASAQHRRGEPVRQSCCRSCCPKITSLTSLYTQIRCNLFPKGRPKKAKPAGCPVLNGTLFVTLRAGIFPHVTLLAIPFIITVR